MVEGERLRRWELEVLEVGEARDPPCGHRLGRMTTDTTDKIRLGRDDPQFFARGNNNNTSFHLSSLIKIVY